MPTSTTPTHRHALTLPIMVAIATLSGIAMVACGGGSDSTSTTTSSTSTTSTAGVLCDYSSSVFNSSPSVNATASATASMATPCRQGWWRHSAIDRDNRARHIRGMLRRHGPPSDGLARAT